MTSVIRPTITLHDFSLPTHHPINALKKYKSLQLLKLLHFSALGAIFTELGNKAV